LISVRMATRNISRRKSRTVLTMIAIVLGTALLVGVNVATTGALKQFTQYLNRFWGQTDIIIEHVGYAPFDAGNITLIRESFSYIENTAARVSSASMPGPSTVFINNDPDNIAGIVGIAAQDDYEYTAYNITGSSSVSGYDVVVGNTIADKYDVKINDSFNLTIRTRSGAYQNYTMRAVGIYYPTSGTRSIDVFMDITVAQEVTGLQGKVSVVFAKVRDQKRVVETRDLLQKELGVEFEVSAPKIESQQRTQSQLAGFQIGLNVMVMAALLVSGFLVFNTMFMTVKERTYEIGVLRSVGTSRRQVFLVFLEESLVLGAVGTVIGVFAGLALSNLFGLVLQQAFQLSTFPSLTLTPDAVVIGVIGGLLTVVFGAVYPAISASRVNILQALRPEMRAKKRFSDAALLAIGLVLSLVGAGFAMRVLPFAIPYVDMFLMPLGLVMFATVSAKKVSKALTAPITYLTNSVGTLLSKTVARKLLRNAVTIGMIGISLAFTIMLGGVQGAMRSSLESGVKEALGADIILIANRTLPLDFKNNLTSLEPEKVQSVTPVGLYWAGTRVFNGDNQSNVGVLVIEPQTFPNIISYRFIGSTTADEVYGGLASKNETLILPEGLALKLGVSVGSNLGVVTPDYGPKNFTVVGIFTGAALQFISLGYLPMSQSIILSFGSESTYFYGGNQAMMFLVNLGDSFKKESQSVVDSINSSFPQYDFGENSRTLQGLLAGLRTNIDQIFSIFYLIVYFAIFIATIGIAIIMIMNVTERRREIGLLRSQGMSRNQILGMLLAEACLTGIIGFLVGLLSGLLMLRSLTSTTTIIGLWMPFTIPWSTMAQALALAIIASLAGALYPAFKASRLSITRALQQR
jgi:putative ABC transport system permease protein